ncbi:MAG: serine hydrolase domain-containing protein [Aureispira sp.]
MRPLLLCFILFVLYACQGTKNLSNKSIDELSDLQQLLDKVRMQYKMPAMAVALIKADQVELAVSGERRLGGRVSVQIEDRFHLGSTTKALTAHWAGALVEAGLITWDTKVLEVFPHWKDDAFKTYHQITLSDLLCHRAYIKPFTGAQEISQIPRFSGNPREQRRSFAKWLLRQNPAKIGAQDGYTYSNAGYSVATAMLEEISKSSWELAIEADVLEPLGIKGVFGWPTDADPEQPFGHHSIHPLDSNLRPVTARNMFPMPKILAPSGDLSLSIGAYSKFVSAHLKGVQGKDNLLQSTTYEYLHYGRENYAMGWTRLLKNGVHISTHDGSAGTFYTHTSILKEKDMAIVIFVNASNIYATKAVYSLKKRLMELHAPNL